MKLNTHEQALLTLLRSGLNDTGERVPESFTDWMEAARLAQRQTVLGLAARAILSDREYVARIPKALKLKLKSFVVTNAMTYDNMTGTLAEVVNVLRTCGVEPVLLKGHGLAANYPEPALRQCGDIDLYVGEASLQAHEVLSASADRIDNRAAAEYGKHFSAFFKETEVEVHRHTSCHASRKFSRVYDEAAAEGLSENLQYLEVQGTKVATPAPEFNAYYVFDHLFEHFLISGIGLRHLCDWMLYLKKYGADIDRGRLGKLLEDMDMMEPWQVFGNVIIRYLGFPKEDFPFHAESDKTDKVLGFILKEGNFGQDTAYYKGRGEGFLRNKFNALRFHVSRAWTMSSLFPKHEMRHLQYLFVRALRSSMRFIRSKTNGR